MIHSQESLLFTNTIFFGNSDFDKFNPWAENKSGTGSHAGSVYNNNSESWPKLESSCLIQ